MTLAQTTSVALVGAEARLVEVEVDVPGRGLPGFRIVGLPAASVREAEQRTHSALEESSERWPSGRNTANLAPGALRKEGTHFDLALAVGIVAADGRLPREGLQDWIFIGELALDGRVRSVPGVLAAAIACRASGRRGLICPAGNAPEAAIIDGIEVAPVSTLRECMAFLRGRWQPPPVQPLPPDSVGPGEDMSDVRGQMRARKAAEIAAAGGHNLVLIGPPGSGKTMIARRLASLLPNMSMDESLEVTLVHSIAGLLNERATLITKRPFRTPHHNVSVAGLVGGGPGLARPGEASLAHHGVLFLDELSLYRADVLDSLRTPLEEGVIRVARSGGVVTFPCRFALVAAMNPCPCGYADTDGFECSCPPLRVLNHRSRLSGPLMDRFDIQVKMRPLTKDELLGDGEFESSAEIAQRVEAARAAQADRYGSPLITNSSAGRSSLERAVSLTGDARAMVERAIDCSGLSGRGVARILRLARTLADLDQRADVREADVSQALSFRLLDRAREAVA